MVSFQPFKWRHFQSKIILLNLRWYCRYLLSYRNLEEMMAERGLNVDHSTINRWVLDYAPKLDLRCRPHLKSINDSWRVDKTYVKVKKQWKYLYCAVDSEGNTLDFLLSAKRDTNVAKRFFTKVLKGTHVQEPRVINVDKNLSYPPTIEQMKESGILPEDTEFRQVKYLNNIVEQDRRGVKHLINPAMSFGSFNSARRTIEGYEMMNMIRKGQIQDVEKGDVMGIDLLHQSNFRISCLNLLPLLDFCYPISVFATQPLMLTVIKTHTRWYTARIFSALVQSPALCRL